MDKCTSEAVKKVFRLYAPQPPMLSILACNPKSNSDLPSLSTKSSAQRSVLSTAWNQSKPISSTQAVTMVAGRHAPDLREAFGRFAGQEQRTDARKPRGTEEMSCADFLAFLRHCALTDANLNVRSPPLIMMTCVF